MNAHKFVAEKGVEEAKRVLSGAPDWATHFDGYLYSEKQFHGSCISLSELKQVVESVEIVKELGSLKSAKANVREMYVDSSCDYVHPGAGLYDYKHLKIGRVIKAIADYELIDSYKENQKVKYCIDCGSENLHIGGEIKEPKMCLDCFAKMVGFTNVDGNYVETGTLEMVDVSPRCEVRNG